MTAQLSRERLEEIKEFGCARIIKPISDEEILALVDMALAGMGSEPVAVIDKEGSPMTRAECNDDRVFAICCKVGTPLYAAPPAPVAVPDEQHSERFEWSYEDWANHLGGRHQNNDPACYYEFGSFMAVAEMLRQFGNVQRKIGWNACRAAMLKAGPVTGWIKCSERMPEEGVEVLVTKKFCGMKTGFYSEGVSGNWRVYGATWIPDYWMPLPAAPEQDV